MNVQSVNHATFAIERTYPTTPERVFAAFADPAKKRRWYAEGGHHEVLEFKMDFRVGGHQHTTLRLGEDTPFPGTSMVNDSHYLDIVPNRRIVIAYSMAFCDKIFSASLSTFELRPVETGTTLVFTEQAAFFEGSDGPQMREAGWRGLLEQLAHELAEPHAQPK